jgi:hypothetical protein
MLKPPKPFYITSIVFKVCQVKQHKQRYGSDPSAGSACLQSQSLQNQRALCAPTEYIMSFFL